MLTFSNWLTAKSVGNATKIIYNISIWSKSPQEITNSQEVPEVMTQAPVEAAASGFEEDLERLVGRRVASLQRLGDDRPVGELVSSVRMDYERRIRNYRSRMQEG